MNIKTRAPTKIIFFGEHYVVYGAPALSVAVDVDREIQFELLPYEGKDKVIINNPVYGEGGTLYPDGTIEGANFILMFAAIYKDIYEKTPELKGKAIKATLLGGRIFKGMGASSALGACLALGLYKYGNKKVDLEEIFRCAQIGDEIDHGGRPSGIDARTVVHGGMIKFWREFNPDKYNFEMMKVGLPKDTSILIVDTFRGERCNTGDLVKAFGKSHGINVKPGELSQEERDKVMEPYLDIYNSALKEMNENGNAKKLGELMNKNHELLKQHGISTDVIEQARKIVMDNGGLGFKITGAGGTGGAVIAYMYKKDLDKISAKLKENEFDFLLLKPTNDTVRLL
jgi:mevalonate kinase